MNTETIKGFVTVTNVGDNCDALCIGKYNRPIADIFEDYFLGYQVTVRYWISKEEKSKNELIESIVKTLCGDIKVDYYDRYSELTGYLWTEENLIIGGHDLMRELRSNVGNYIHLEIDIHETT